MLLRFLAGVSLIAAPVTAQPVDAGDRAERDLLEKVIEIPTVQFRGQMPRLVQLMSGELGKAGISDITVKADGGTILCRVLSDEYFVCALLDDPAHFGKGRWILRSTAASLNEEL